MRTIHKLRITASLFMALMFAPALRAQPGNWQAVQNLKPGSRVNVKAQHSYLCFVEGATEDKLTCEVQKKRSLGTTTITIPRAEVREVRVLPSQTKDAWIGAAIGAAAGAVAAASSHKTGRGAVAFAGALAGAGAGALVGAMVPVFQRGKVIYKR